MNPKITHRIQQRTTQTLARLCIASCIALLTPLTASANYQEIVVFGDSLSDNGNLAAVNPAAGQLLNSPPYFEGRVSNGPVAVDVLAKLLGLPLSAYFENGGNNYAVAGARARRTGDTTGDAIRLNSQVSAYLATKRPSPSTLIVMVIGGNDVRDSRGMNRNQAKRQLSRATAAVASEIRRLRAVGGENFLIGGVADIASIPETRIAARQLGVEVIRRARFGSAFFNASLQRQLARVEASTEARIVYADIIGTIDRILRDPDDYGFSVLTRGCFDLNDQRVPVYDRGCDANGVKILKYPYFDSIHPTAKIHDRIGRYFYTVAPVPLGVKNI